MIELNNAKSGTIADNPYQVFLNICEDFTVKNCGDVYLWNCKNITVSDCASVKQEGCSGVVIDNIKGEAKNDTE
jgi:hypothetical protein